jgi:hypothetical protein
MKPQEAKTEIPSVVRTVAEERLKKLADWIADAEALEVKRDDEARNAKTNIDKMKAEQEQIAAFLQAH